MTFEEFMEATRGYQSEIEQRVRDQLKRHFQIDPTVNPSSVVDIQMAQERENLERALQKFEDDENDTGADAMTLLIEYLPEFAERIKSQGLKLR